MRHDAEKVPDSYEAGLSLVSFFFYFYFLFFIRQVRICDTTLKKRLNEFDDTQASEMTVHEVVCFRFSLYVFLCVYIYIYIYIYIFLVEAQCSLVIECVLLS